MCFFPALPRRAISVVTNTDFVVECNQCELYNKSMGFLKTELEDMQVNVRLKLSALWASFMFLYIYVDYFHLYMPGSIKDILAGKMYVFEINQVALLIGLVSVSIPALMICLCVLLPAQMNRWTNLVTATVYIPYTLFNLVGEAWVHMMVGAAIEVGLLLYIIRCAWKWPRLDGANGNSQKQN